MSTFDQLPRPKFTVEEVDACEYLEQCQVNFLVDLATKEVTACVDAPMDNLSPIKWPSLPALAVWIGWANPHR